MGRTKKNEVDEFGIPIEEIIKVRENDHTGTLRYIISQHPLLPEFYLYQIDNGSAKKIATEDVPEFKKLEKDRAKWKSELDKIKEENDAEKR